MYTLNELAEEVAETEAVLASTTDEKERVVLLGIRGSWLRELEIMLPDADERRRLLAGARRV